MSATALPTTVRRLLAALALLALLPATAGASEGDHDASQVKHWAMSAMAWEESLSRTDFVNAARDRDLVVGNPNSMGRHLPAMREVNPDVVGLVYVNGSYHAPNNPKTYPDWWYLRDRNGNKVTSGRFGAAIMAFHTDAWRNEVLAQCQEHIDRWGFDGCYLDNLGTVQLAAPTWFNSRPIDPRTGREWTTADWQRDLAGLAAHVRAGLGGATLYANGLGHGAAYFEYGTHQLASASDGVASELFLRHSWWEADRFPTPQQWLDEVRMVEDVQARGSEALLISKMWVDSTRAQQLRWLEYAMASMLMADQGDAYLFFIDHGCEPPCQMPDGHLNSLSTPEPNLGNPTHARRVLQPELHERRFQRGRVLVNVGNTARTVTLWQPMVDLRGIRHEGSVTIGPDRGLVLVNENAATPPPPEPSPSPDPTPSPDPSPTPSPEPSPGTQLAPDTCDGLAATIRGTDGNDVIEGTTGRDVIHAGDGDDVVRSLEGDDVVCLGGGDDYVEGGPGQDRLIGGPGADTLIGQGGADALFGLGGNDLLRGSWGNDELVGGAGNDHLIGEQGDDALNGSAGYDECHGGVDVDTLASCEQVNGW